MTEGFDFDFTQDQLNGMIHYMRFFLSMIYMI
jgi:hypothetical protein